MVYGRTLSPLLVAGLLLYAPSPSAAQGLDAKLFDPVPSPHALLNTHSARVLGHLETFGGLTFNYSNDLLVGLDGRQIIRPLHHRVAAEVGLALGLLDRVEVGLAMPVFLRQIASNYVLPGGGESGQAGPGDLRLLAKLALLGGASDGGLGLALLAELSLPTGDEGRFMGDSGVTFTPRLVLDYWRVGGLRLALNVGYRVRRNVVVEDLALGDELRISGGLEQPLGLLGLSAGAEVAAAIGLSSLGDDASVLQERSSPVEVLGLLRWRSGSGMIITAGGGVGMTDGYGAPDARAVLSFGFSPSSVASGRAAAATSQPTSRPAGPAAARSAGGPDQASRAATPNPTPSGDGVRPALDGAAFDAAAATDRDPDGDGLEGDADRCPNEAEDRDSYKDDDGCPEADNDGDGIPDGDDRCPNEPETINGVKDDDGCPDTGKARVAVVGGRVRIDDKIYFVSGSDVLEQRSLPILRQVAALLKANWVIRLVRVEGHTDDRGDKEMNVDLSERRAQRVVEFLVTQGVARHRLAARGLGPLRPISSNATRPGRTKNRRVEFNIARRAEPTGGAK